MEDLTSNGKRLLNNRDVKPKSEVSIKNLGYVRKSHSLNYIFDNTQKTKELREKQKEKEDLILLGRFKHVCRRVDSISKLCSLSTMEQQKKR